MAGGEVAPHLQVFLSFVAVISANGPTTIWVLANRLSEAVSLN